MAIRVHGEWKDPCPGCGALDGCCETAQARLETANELTRLVDRQREKITEQDTRIKAIVEAAEKAQCGCSISQRDSGHAVDCWRPELDEALAGKQEGVTA
jgi:enterochelin esterase-like enzyme